MADYPVYSPKSPQFKLQLGPADAPWFYPPPEPGEWVRAFRGRCRNRPPVDRTGHRMGCSPLSRGGGSGAAGGTGGYGLHLLSHGPMMRRSNWTLLVPQKDMSDDAGVVLDDNLAATLNIPGRGLDHPDRVPAAAPRPDRVHHVLVTVRRAVGTAASRIVPVNDRMCRHLAGGRLRVRR